MNYILQLICVVYCRKVYFPFLKRKEDGRWLIGVKMAMVAILLCMAVGLFYPRFAVFSNTLAALMLVALICHTGKLAHGNRGKHEVAKPTIRTIVVFAVGLILLSCCVAAGLFMKSKVRRSIHESDWVLRVPRSYLEHCSIAKIEVGQDDTPWLLMAFDTVGKSQPLHAQDDCAYVEKLGNAIGVVFDEYHQSTGSLKKLGDRLRIPFGDRSEWDLCAYADNIAYFIAIDRSNELHKASLLAVDLRAIGTALGRRLAFECR